MGFGVMEKSSSLSQLVKNDSVSRLKERFGHGPKEPMVVDLSIRHDVVKCALELSKEYEVTSQLQVHSAENLSSSVVNDISPGSRVVVLAIGNCGRYKVSNTLGTVQGWVSSVSSGKCMLRKTDNVKDHETSSNSGLRSNSLTSFFSNASSTSRVSRASRVVSSSLTRLRGKKDLGLDQTKQQKKDAGLDLTKHPQIGDTVEAEGKVIVREEESLSSQKIMTLRGGSQLRILDYGISNSNRLKVSVEGKVGWVSILDKNLHEPLFGKRPHSY
jgi:hypothetical protein